MQDPDLNGSVTRTRTWDPVINSHLLYQLSYHGTGSRILVALPPSRNAFFRQATATTQAGSNIAFSLTPRAL